MSVDSQAGYVEPSPGGVTLYLDAEETNRLKEGINIVRQRVSDPAALMVLNTIHEGIGILTSAVEDIEGGGASGVQQIQITADSVGLAKQSQLASAVSHLSDIANSLEDQRLEDGHGSASATPSFIKVVNTEDFPEFDNSQLAKEVTLASAVSHLQTIVEQTDGLELKLTDIDLNTDEIEASLVNLFNELAEKLEVGDITGLATFAEQQAQTGILASALEEEEITASATYSLQQKDLALDSTLQNRYGGNKTPIVQTVTSSGNTIVHTPASGKRIVLYWVSAINDPDQSSAPLIKISIGSLECYRTYAVAHWEIFIGEIDASLVVNLSEAASVALTAHIKEF